MEPNKLLREVGTQLEKWADEAKTGEWSTHQVKPMKRLAEKIFAHLGRISKPKE